MFWGVERFFFIFLLFLEVFLWDGWMDLIKYVARDVILILSVLFHLAAASL